MEMSQLMKTRSWRCCSSKESADRPFPASSTSKLSLKISFAIFLVIMSSSTINTLFFPDMLYLLSSVCREGRRVRRAGADRKTGRRSEASCRFTAHGCSLAVLIYLVNDKCVFFLCFLKVFRDIFRVALPYAEDNIGTGGLKSAESQIGRHSLQGVGIILDGAECLIECPGCE